MLTDGAEITTSESRSSTRGTLFAIRHIWTIEHFSFLLDEKLIESAIFHHEEHDEFKWKIELDPQGSEEDYKDYISLYLFLDSCSKRNARAFVKYSFLDAKKQVVRERELSKPNEFSPGGNWGFGMFMKRDQLLDHLKKTSSNVLSVRVELEVVIDIVTSPSYILAPKTEITDCRASEISSGVIGYRMPADVVLTVNGEKCDASKTGLVAGCPQVFTEMLTQGEIHRETAAIGVTRSDSCTEEPTEPSEESVDVELTIPTKSLEDASDFVDPSSADRLVKTSETSTVDSIQPVAAENSASDAQAEAPKDSTDDDLDSLSSSFSVVSG